MLTFCNVNELQKFTNQDNGSQKIYIDCKLCHVHVWL